MSALSITLSAPNTETSIVNQPNVMPTMQSPGAQPPLEGMLTSHVALFFFFLMYFYNSMVHFF